MPSFSFTETSCPKHPLHRLDVCSIKHQTYGELIVCLPPRIRYIDPMFTPKVKDIHRVGCAARYDSIKIS